MNQDFDKSELLTIRDILHERGRGRLHKFTGESHTVIDKENKLLDKVNHLIVGMEIGSCKEIVYNLDGSKKE